MPNESIGGISVSITIDQSDFKAQLDQAVSLAKDSSAKIGQALSSGAGQSDQFTASVDRLIKSLGDAGTALQNVNSQTGQLGNASGQAAVGFDQLGAALGHIAGFSLSIAGIAAAVTELGSASIDAYANLQRATLALTSLTGSGVTAEHEIAGLKALAQDEALSFPELLQANQRLTALGVSAQQIPAFLRAAADGAAAMNTSLIVASNAIDRMVASGSVAGRNLTQLGLTTNDLGRIMGVAANRVGAAFRAMDESNRVEVMIQALQKFDGAAARVADSVQGSFQRLENTSTFALQHIGEAMAPAVKGFTDLASVAIPAIADLTAIVPRADSSIVAFAESLGGFKDAAINAVASLVPFGDQLKNSEKASAVLGDSFRDSVLPGLDLITHGFNLAAVAVQLMTQHGSDANMDKMIQNIDRLSHSAQALGGADFKNAWDAALFSIGKVASATQTVITEQETANQKLQAAQIAYDQLSSQLKKLTAGTGEYNEKQLETNRALVELDKAQKSADVSAKALTDSFQADEQAAAKLIQNVNQAQSAYDRLAASQDGSQKQSVALGIAARNLATAQQQLQAATDGLTVAQEKHLDQGVKPMGPAYDGLNKLLSEVSGNMRIQQQAVTDATTGETTYIGVVKSLTSTQAAAHERLQQLYDLRAKWIEQGINVKTVDSQIKQAEDTFVKSLEEGIDPLQKHTAALHNKANAERDGVSSVGALQHAHEGFASSLIRGASDIQASVDDENNAFLKALEVFNQLSISSDGTARSQQILAEAIRQLENAARAAGVDLSNLSQVEQAVGSSGISAAGGLGRVSEAVSNATSGVKGLKSGFDDLGVSINNSVNGMQVWAAAVAYAHSAMATTTPQEGVNGQGSPGWLESQYGRLKALELTQIAYPNAYLDQYGQVVIPGLTSANSKAPKPTSSTGSTSGSTSGTTGGGTSTSGGVDAIAKALIDAQNAYSQATSGASAALPNVAEIQKLSDALQLATNNYLNAGHAISDLGTITADATTGLTTLSTAINGIGTAASSMGSAVTQSATITQAAVNASAAAVQAQSAIVSKVQAFLDTPVGTAITSPASSTTSSTLAYAAIGAPKVGTNWTPTVIINNPVVTSQSQADQMASQLVNTLRNVVGLKL